MLRASLGRKDASRMRQLVPKMRKLECDDADTWYVGNCLSLRRGLSDDLMQLLRSLPEDGLAPGDVWLRAQVAWAGLGQREDSRAAHAILLRRQDHPLCSSLLGQLYMLDEEMQDDALAFRVLSSSAEAGNSEGMFLLARLYEEGWGVEQNFERAYELMQQAAAKLHPDALSRLGHYLQFGVGVDVDEKQALHYYSRSAAYGNATALFNLASMYFHGIGMERNRRKAASVFRQALLEGEVDAEFFLRELKTDAPESVIPCGEWCPDPFMHQYVPDSMHQQMRTVLLMHIRRGSVFARLPKHLIISILFWICTDPLE